MQLSSMDLSQLEFSIFECALLDLKKHIQEFNKLELANKGYKPIETIKHRIKSPSSIVNKMEKKKLPLSYESIIENIHDIGGMRIICSFVDNIYTILNFLETLPGLEILNIKDYVKTPKENGYRSLHAIVKIPVFFNDYEEDVIIELQLRTVAMDFWATLEHKLIYKSVFSKNIDIIRGELNQYAHLINALDENINHLRNKVTTDTL